MSNPFKPWSKNYIDFETMSDLKWHCTKCELVSWQAKTWQVWRQEKWIQLDWDWEWKREKRMFCKHCNKTTVHRKLKSLDILEETKARSWISPKISKRVKEIYDNEEAITLRKLSDRELEVDHKFPQIRRLNDEKTNDSLTNEELKQKFMLLSRANNLRKSRQCEHCFKTWKRWCFPWIPFRYKWNESWDKNIDVHDEKWCEWCFWHDPYKWREELKNKITWNTH